MKILILDDDPQVLGLFEDLLCLAMPDAEIVTHLDHKEFLNDPALCTADLYIIDILLNEIDGRAIYEMLPPECRAVPTLYVSGLGDRTTGESFDFKRLLREQPYIEFIAKPISIELFKNRVLMLLRASGRLLDNRHSDVWRQMLAQDRARINAMRQSIDLKPLSDLMIVGKLKVENGQ